MLAVLKSINLRRSQNGRPKNVCEPICGLMRPLLFIDIWSVGVFHLV
jgi:hypothetical protein